MVAEAGTHLELLEKKGRYYNMWRKQIKAERAMEQAFQMVAKAKALTESAERPGSSGNEGSPSEDASENEGDRQSTSTLVNPSLATKALMRAAEKAQDGTSSRGGSTLGEDPHQDEEELRGAYAGDRPNLAPGDRLAI